MKIVSQNPDINFTRPKPCWFLPLLFFLIMTCLSLTVLHAEVSSKKNVLILNSYHRGFKWTDEQTSAAIDTLNKEVDDIEIFVEYLDTKRRYNHRYIHYLAQVFKLKYEDITLDAIITTDDNALHFVKDFHEEIFKGAPVSFCGINHYSNFDFDKDDNITGLVEVLDIKETIELALESYPETEKLYVVVDNTTTGKGQLKSAIEVSQELTDLEFIFLKGSEYSTGELLDKLRSLPGNSIVLLTVWLQDKNNVYISEKKGGQLISKNSTVPVFGIVDMYFGHGIVGGKLLNSHSHGKMAAEIAVRILNGETASDIPVVFRSTNPYMFDFRELARWKIDLSKLPPNRIVIHQPRSVYREYKKLIWGTVITFLLLVAFVVFLMANILKRKKTERALKKSEEQIEASLKEKETLLQEIHHRVKNNMQIIASLLKLQLNQIDKKDVDSILKENMGRVYAMATIHESLHQSEKLSEIDFRTYLQKLTQMLSQTYAVNPGKITFHIETPDLKLAIDKANPLGLVMNELISNALKYAFPDSQKGMLTIKSTIQNDNNLELIVADDGVGMPEGFDWTTADSLGLRLVRDIVERQLNGSIHNENRNGTRFTIAFALE